ncbi:MAG: DUF4180 domain-containing protein [Bacteroidales bacterium]
MTFKEHDTPAGTLVEVRSDEIIIREEQDALDLMANVQYLHDSNHILVHHHQLGEEFFDLKSGLAGAVLQKFSNYRVRLTIVADLSAQNSKSLRDFVRESNRTGHIRFVSSLEEALGGSNG